MLCEETRQSLSQYVDDCVSLPARVAIDEHLDRCPVCRDEAIELRSLRRRLSLLTPPTPPPNLAATISNALAIEAAARRQQPIPSLGHRIRRFIEPWVMPYSAGSFASVIMFFLMFAALRPHFVALREAAAQQRDDVLIIQSVPGYDLHRPVGAGLAASRAPFGAESPTLNPGGALAALMISDAQPDAALDADADDMIVVTDVFSNGQASLAYVVQPPRDKRLLDEFVSALRQRRPPFVQASFDRRPETMRVVVAVQKVDVDEGKF